MEHDIGQNNREKNSPGEVWVKEGKVFVKDPAGGGNFPTITPCSGLELLINGIKVEEKTTVSEKDIIEIITETREEEKGTYRIKVAPGGLSASLEIKTGTVFRHYVQDSEPENNLVLKLSSSVDYTCPFTFTEIMQEIAKENINYGIKHDVIYNIIEKPEDGEYIIAEGEPPGETIDERVELIFQEKLDEKKADQNKKVDFRDMVEILSVEPNTLLAVKHPGVQGNMGRNVMNDIIPPAKPQVYELVAGKGAEISSDGNKALSKIGGSPVVKKLGNRYIIDVNPVLQRKGDVDISSGNIRFKGDVVVHGNVCEGMSVQAAGKININGMVFTANVASQGNLIVKQNITGSKLVAGGDKTFYNNFFKALAPIRSDLSEIAKLVPGLAQHPQLKNVKTGQIIQVLIDKKYSRLPNLINELIKFAGENSFILPNEISQLLENIENNLRGLNILKLDSLENLHNLLLKMDESHKVMESMAQNKANVSFGYAVNSKIEASGDVKVNGRGCINTTIHAGGNVSIIGVFRGGKIVAGGDIILNEAGSELGAKTYVKTDGKRKVFIRKAYEGVRIQIGDRLVNITSTQSNIIAELDRDGMMAINTSKSL